MCVPYKVRVVAKSLMEQGRRWFKLQIRVTLLNKLQILTKKLTILNSNYNDIAQPKQNFSSEDWLIKSRLIVFIVAAKLILLTLQ
jgi:hypothetical protein